MPMEMSLNSSRPRLRGIYHYAISALCLGTVLSIVSTSYAQAFSVTNILSDGSVPAQATHASFINPWAVSASPKWWISAQGFGLNYVLPASGTPAFTVLVPLAAQPTMHGLPLGSVTTSGSTGFLLTNGSTPSFIFSTLDGIILGWTANWA